MKRIYVIKEKCNGCMNCVVACQKAHADSEFYASIRDSEPTRIHLQVVERSPVPLVCRHCEEPACVKACMTGAMQKDEKTGIVSNEFNPQKCIGCWMCVMACPFGVISLKQDGDRKIAVKCDICVKRGSPACVDSCPKGAIVYMEDEEFAEYKRQLSLENIASDQGGDEQ
ncbi:MAG TPA: 4Fe-4S dicluster domain-containing protein [Pseudobacteroides sp.]|uniref:4Fe-4S dicluster domain-containing protein n=1 Tax=Pseudobacteroides sp. TaxID=1968840 RepID=UPI002F9572D0